MHFSRVIASFLCVSFVGVVSAGDPKAGADVVGRDLSVRGLGALGHVGVWTGTSVLEVLNEGTVIYQNTLKNFKGKSAYWGAKYGVGASKSAQIVSAGWGQRNFSPVYTTTAQWREGGVTQKVCTKYNKAGVCTSQKTTVTTALFRCDTFVDFSFKKGNGASLVNAAILPRILYNALPSTR